MAIRCEEKWPLLLVTWVGEADDREFDEYIAWLQRTNRMPGKRALLMDLSGGAKLPTAQLNKQAQQIKGDTALIANNSVGIAFVVQSLVTRTLLKSVLFVSPLPVPHVVVPSVADATAWINTRLEGAGMPRLP